MTKEWEVRMKGEEDIVEEFEVAGRGDKEVMMGQEVEGEVAAREQEDGGSNEARGRGCNSGGNWRQVMVLNMARNV